MRLLFQLRLRRVVRHVREVGDVHEQREHRKGDHALPHIDEIRAANRGLAAHVRGGATSTRTPRRRAPEALATGGPAGPS